MLFAKFFVNHPSLPCTMATDEKIVLQAAACGRERHSLTHLWDGLPCILQVHDTTGTWILPNLLTIAVSLNLMKKKKRIFVPWNYLYSSSILKHDFESLMTSQFPPTVIVGAAVGRKRWSKQSHVKRPSLAIRYLMFFTTLPQSRTKTNLKNKKIPNNQYFTSRVENLLLRLSGQHWKK